MADDDARKEQRQAGADGGDISRRLERLGANLNAKRQAAAPVGSSRGSSAGDRGAMGRAFRASTEFVAGVIAGGGLGWIIDRGLGTKPWGLIVFLMLGFVAGIYNVMRTSGFLSPSSVGAAPASRERED